MPFRAAQNELFRQLIDAAPDAMVVMGETGSIALVNVQTEKLFGYARDELIGQPIEMLVPKRLRAQHRMHRTSYSQTPKARAMGADIELYGVRKDGSEFPVEISLSPLETDEGTLVSSAIRDITERRETEAAARLASDRLLSAVESIQGMLALYDAQDRLVLCNSAWRELFSRGVEGPVVGRTHAEVLDATLTHLVELADEPQETIRRRFLDYHRNPVGTLDLRTREGRSLRLTERQTLEGGIVSTLWDITDDVEHEAELKKAQELAEAANSAKSEFLSSMSHELRTPLNSILGFAQLLQRNKKAPLTESQKGQLEYVLKGGEHLLHLIDDILDLSRVEAGRIMVSSEPVGIAGVFAEVKTTLEPMASRAGVAFSVEAVPAEVSEIIADRTRFSQVLINFGSNALKYGKKGGHTSLAAAAAGDGFVRISVTDDGIGIPADQQDKIFQPFHRAGQETGPIEGTGIGLAITKRLAELMGGSVGFRSTPGEGSVFWIDLESRDELHGVRRSTPSSFEATPPQQAGDPGVSHLVVYIEDNPSNIAFMQGLLGELEGVSLVCAPTAEVGIEIVRARRPDVVIMDINLPGMSGYEATKKLRAWPETKTIPVIALTAAAMASDRKRASELGFYKYFTEPVKVAELLDTLETLFNRRRSRRDGTPEPAPSGCP